MKLSPKKVKSRKSELSDKRPMNINIHNQGHCYLLRLLIKDNEWSLK